MLKKKKNHSAVSRVYLIVYIQYRGRLKPVRFSDGVLPLRAFFPSSRRPECSLLSYFCHRVYIINIECIFFNAIEKINVYVQFRRGGFIIISPLPPVGKSRLRRRAELYVSVYRRIA